MNDLTDTLFELTGKGYSIKFEQGMLTEMIVSVWKDYHKRSRVVPKNMLYALKYEKEQILINAILQLVREHQKDMARNDSV